MRRDLSIQDWQGLQNSWLIVNFDTTVPAVADKYIEYLC